ncbi:MAG: Fic family protein [Planctomycetes bacterium]|nr:Fic family protein [Planctomycetota bacterium]
MSPVQYHLGKFPPDNLDWDRITPMLGPAHQAVAKFDGILAGIPEPDILLSPLTYKESVLSSRIEGTQATLSEVLEYEAEGNLDDESTPEKAEYKEVLNYKLALKKAVSLLDELPLSNRLIKSAHKVLMQGVRGADKEPGEFRRIQNWIGPYGQDIENARFVPCPVNELQKTIGDWEKYIHTNASDQLVQLALIHAEFEAIHPFKDGNGRIGRLIVPLFLFAKGLLSRPAFYISEYLERNRDEYYERLLAVSRDDDWTGWVVFFLEAISKEGQASLLRARQILALYNLEKDRVLEITGSKFSVRALDWFFSKPIFRSTGFVKSAGIPEHTARKILAKLRDSGMLSEVGQASGNRAAILTYPALLNITETDQI